MPQKLKELLDNPWFKGFLALLMVALIAGHLSRCAGTKSIKSIPTGNSAAARWGKLLLVIDQIDKNYTDTINYRDIMESAIPSLLQSLDPHSIYLPPRDLEEADQNLKGNFSGIGIGFNVPNDTAIVINVIPGGPSSKAGLLSGDRIVEVEGKVVAGVNMPQDSLIARLRGPKDTKVKVGIKRAGVQEVLDFEITRGVVPIKSLEAALMLTDTLGYIRLSNFSRFTYKEFMAGIAKLGKLGMKSLVLDLRDNPGGYMDQAYEIANEFLQKNQMVVYMEGRKRPREEFRATGKGILGKLKLYVLINENSASSSEIVAGAMQDNDRGIIVGRRSFGKGLVQEPIYFSDSSGIRLTVARFYTPSGRCIQKPYSADYRYDILERYQHGEMSSKDSIRINDSLLYRTANGRKVYGGGGIIPDIFVPVDTVGVTELLVQANRKSLQMKFSSYYADRNREKLWEIKTLEELDELYRQDDIKNQFLLFAASNGVRPKNGEWEKSGYILLQQIKGLVGRYSQLDADAYYPYILRLDNAVNKIKEIDSLNTGTSIINNIE